MAFPNLNFARPVLPNNRAYLLSTLQECQPIFVLLALEPRGQQLPPTTVELRDLVHDKVRAQDAALRAHLETLQWNIEDGSVLRLVFRDIPLEKVRTFPFLTLYFLNLCVPIVCSSALYALTGAILYPGGDIVQAHFRREGMVSPPLLSRDDHRARPCKGYKPFWCALSLVCRCHWHQHALLFPIQKISLRPRMPWKVRIEIQDDKSRHT